MLDIIHYAEKEDLEAIVMSLDFVKCFDKCSFSILHGSLDYFGFGQVVKKWTKILYKDYTVKVQNNGHFSDSIQINKGVHQGGCCSSIYFLVIAEILAISLRSNKDIEGITIRDIKNILNQFADDMDICSLAKENSIRKIMEELDKFRKQSGFTVSYEKTTLYRIGSLRFSDAQLYNMSEYVWSNKRHKCTRHHDSTRRHCTKELPRNDRQSKDNTKCLAQQGAKPNRKNPGSKHTDCIPICLQNDGPTTHTRQNMQKHRKFNKGILCEWQEEQDII